MGATVSLSSAYAAAGAAGAAGAGITASSFKDHTAKLAHATTAARAKKLFINFVEGLVCAGFALLFLLLVVRYRSDQLKRMLSPASPQARLHQRLDEEA